jgi:hypothetical protein
MGTHHTTTINGSGQCGEHPAPCDCAMLQARVPAYFFWDHNDRGCVTQDGTATPKPPHSVVVQLRACDMRDLMNDAEYYASSTEFRSFDPTLYSSARSTVRALMRQGYPRTTTWYLRGLTPTSDDLLAAGEWTLERRGGRVYLRGV